MMTDAVGSIALGTTLGCAAFGGFCINVMNLLEDSKKSKSARVPKDALYWIWWPLWPVIAAGLTYVLLIDGSSLHPFLAFTTGLTVPSTLSRLIQTAAESKAAPANAET
jgi:hypothetical protein